MLLKKIELQGVGSYKEYTSVNLDQGLIGIVGAYDSNPAKSVGAGKSTLMSMTLFAYFGKGDFNNLDEFYSDQLQKSDHCFTRITGIKNNHTYVVERGRKGGSSYLDLTEDDNPIGGSSIASKEKEIQRILGMDYDMLTAANFFEQDKLDKLVATDSAERRNYVDKILNLKIWKRLLDSVNLDVNKLQKELESLEPLLTQLYSIIDSYESQLASLSIEKELLVTLEQQIKDLQNIIEIHDKNKVEFDKRSELQKLLFAKETNLKSLQEQKTLYNKILTASDSSKLSESLVENQEQLNVLEKRLLVLSTTKFESEIAELSKQYDLDLKEQYSCTAELKSLEQQNSKLSVGICSTCEQPITEELIQTRIANNEPLRLSLNKSLESYTKKCEEGKTKLTATKAMLQEANTEITKLCSDKATCKANIQNLSNSIESKKQDSIKYTSLLEKIEPEILEAISSYNSEKAKLDLNNQVVYNVEEHTTLIKTKQELQTKLNLQYSKVGQLDQISIEKAKQEDIIKVNETKKDSIIQEIEKLKVVKQVFTEIPTLLFERSVSIIEAESTKIIQEFIPSMKIFMYEDKDKKNKPLEISYEIDGNLRSYKRLSGGQKSLANLALRLGFSKLISMRTGEFVEFLVMDEPFGYLDVDSREMIRKLLTQLCVWFKQVFVVSHVDNVQDFPKIITVKMNEDLISRIE